MPTRLLLLACVFALLLLPQTAHALSDQPLPTYVTNGAVEDIVRVGDRIYLGGAFTFVGLATGGGASIDASSGAPDASFPSVNGNVNAAAPDGQGGFYIGGSFTVVGGVARRNLAHIDGGGQVTAWNPNPDGVVSAVLATSGSTVYAGGFFNTIGGQTRPGLAALDGTTGAAFVGFNAALTGQVLTMDVSGSSLYIGGTFNNHGRSNVAALNPTTGAVQSWNPSADAGVTALKASGSTVYVGGNFQNVGGQQRDRIAALDAASGNATSWTPVVSGGPNVFAVSGSRVYTGGFFTTVGGERRNRLAAIDAATGTLTDWNPNADGTVFALAASGSTLYAGGIFTSIRGQSRSRLAAIDTATGAPTAWSPVANDEVRALALSGASVYAGGAFTSVGGEPRNRLAGIAASTGIPTAFNPTPDAGGEIRALATSGSTLYAGGSFSQLGSIFPPNFAVFGDPVPVNQSLPLLGGEAVVGRTLTCTPGAWTGSPAFAFAWLRNGAAIAGATAAGYGVTAGDVGQEVRCEVTARNDTGPGVARSAPVVPVAAPAGRTATKPKFKVTCKPKRTGQMTQKRAKVKVICKVRPVTAGRVKLTRDGRKIASARLKKGLAVLHVRPGRYRLALVRDGRVVKRMKLRVRKPPITRR